MARAEAALVREQRVSGQELTPGAWGLTLSPAYQASRSVEGARHPRAQSDSVQDGLRIPDPLKTSSTFQMVTLFPQNSAPVQSMLFFIAALHARRWHCYPMRPVSGLFPDRSQPRRAVGLGPWGQWGELP